MNFARSANWPRALGRAFLLLAFGATAAFAQQATLTGRVTDVESGSPVAGALVNLVGTNIGQHTNADGRYTLRGVPAGAHRVRVLRIGYAEQVLPVTTVAGQEVTLDVPLRAVPTQLSPIVTTATGDQRRLEVGNAVGKIDASKVVDESPVANINDLLNSRTPGVQVLTSGATGTGARVRIRGTNSLSLANDPVYIVDGVRIEASSTGTRAQAIGLGGSLGSRLNDLNPEEIEDIQVLRGPSAATLYGTDAANGVIVITTKRGRAGDPRWSAYVEQGGMKYLQDFPLNYTSFGRTTAGANTSACFVTSVELGTCTRDSLMTFQPLNNKETTIFGTGHRQQYGLQLSGGTEAVRYFVSGEFEDEQGIMKLPKFEQSALGGLPGGIPDFVRHPNTLTRKAGRANLNMSPTQKLDLGVSIGYTQTDQRLPNLDNNLFSPVAQALFASGRRTTTVTSSGAVLNGYRNFTPSDIFEEAYKTYVNRIISSVSANFRPFNFLETRGNFGLDYTGARETDVCLFLDCPDTGADSQLGFSLDDRRQIFQYTADVAGTARFQPTTTLGSATTLGVQYFANVLERTRAQGENLPPGASSPAAGSVPSVSSTTDETRTLGAFVEQALNWRERLFVTGALRYDDNSAFGADFSGVLYPKASVSWIVSQEDFFPAPSWLNSMRIRSAVGQSGVRPGTNDALQFFTAGPTASARLDGTDLPGVVVSAPGNPDLKPETTTEIEAGIDWELFSNRVSLELTYYNKQSQDALIARVLPTSGGTGATTRFENLGKVTNKGFEALLNAQILQSPAFGWDIGISGSHNANKLVEVRENLPAIVTSATVQQRKGYPLNGYWQRKYTYNDADNDGIIRATEITVEDSATFVGSSMPKTEIVFTNGFSFLDQRLRLQTLVDYKGGHYLYNNTERFKCADARNCRGRNDPTASLFEQARSVAATEHPARTLYGFMEKADFIRIREVSLTATAPDSWARRVFRSDGLSATLSARNLGTFTDYTGIDPESTYGQGDVPQDFLTLPPPTYFTFRLNVRY